MLEDANPLTGDAAEPRRDGKPGPWFASVLYKDAPSTARALGQRYLYVHGRRVYVEPLEGDTRRAEVRRRLLNGGRAASS